MTTRWGDIRMGGRDAKPEYSTFTWIAMNICNTLATGILLDAIVVFGSFAAIMTTIGIGTPVTGEILSGVFGIENSFALKLGVIIVFCTFFTLSASKSIARGMGRISDMNVKLVLAFFAFLLIAGDTGFMLNNTVMSIGTNIREFVRMSFNSDAIGNTGFVQSWTIFYLGTSPSPSSAPTRLPALPTAGPSARSLFRTVSGRRLPAGFPSRP